MAGIACRRGCTCSAGSRSSSPGFTGSLMVIAVNGWMNHPTGFALRAARSSTCTRGRAVRQPLPLARARAHVPRRLHRHRLPGGGVYAFGRAARPLGALRAHRAGDPADGRGARGAGPGARRRLGRARGRPRTSRRSSPRSRVWARPRRARPCTSSAGTRTTRSSTASRSPSCCPSGLPRPERHGAGARRRAAGRPSAGQRRARRLPDHGRDRHAARRDRRFVPARPGAQATAARVAVVLPRARARRTAVGRRADRRLGHHRGRPTAVGRLRGDAHRRRRHRRRPHPRRLRDARPVYTGLVGVGVVWILRRLARAPLEAGDRAGRPTRPAAG